MKIEGQTLTPAGSLTLYAVLPLTASGTPGRRELALKVSSGGRQAKIPLAIDVRPSGRLTGTVIEAKSNDRTPLVAKLFVEDAAGRLYVSPGAPNYATQNWYGTWLPRFTYVDGEFDLPLPPGEYRVTAMKGPGYADFVGNVTVYAPDSRRNCRSHEVALATGTAWLALWRHAHACTPHSPGHAPGRRRQLGNAYVLLLGQALPTDHRSSQLRQLPFVGRESGD